MMILSRRFLSKTLAIIVLPCALHSAPEDSIRGFDVVSQTEQVKWEHQARRHIFCCL